MPTLDARKWLRANGYQDVADQIDQVIAEWKIQGKATRRNWWEVLAGRPDGTPNTIAGRTFPVLRVAQLRENREPTDGAIHRGEPLSLDPVRDTGTGGVLEALIIPALTKARFEVLHRVQVGRRPGGGRHIVDVVAKAVSGLQFLVSLKWQQVPGTIEQKIPFEIISLVEAIKTSEGRYRKAYLVLGGEGWKLRKYYVDGGLTQYIAYEKQVSVVTLEDFIARANRQQL
jgi:hypothetical protein